MAPEWRVLQPKEPIVVKRSPDRSLSVLLRTPVVVRVGQVAETIAQPHNSPSNAFKALERLDE
jgi:hypothetical protein